VVGTKINMDFVTFNFTVQRKKKLYDSKLVVIFLPEF